MSSRARTNQPQTPAAATRPLVQQLESLRLAGVEVLPASTQAASPPAAKPPRHAAAPAADQAHAAELQPQLWHESMVTSPTADPLNRQQRAAELQIVAGEVEQCTQCCELAAERTNTVFGVGNPEARLCFLGEGPGADEDRSGEPFVGRAGQLLNKIIAACTLTREEVYILNIVKCRPPGNRNPTGEEAANCRGFLRRQLEIIRPEFICCLGSVAAASLLDTKLSIGKLRGRLHDWNSIRVLATYHPAYLLRNPAAKADVWQDMQLLMQEMGIPLPAKRPS